MYVPGAENAWAKLFAFSIVCITDSTTCLGSKKILEKPSVPPLKAIGSHMMIEFAGHRRPIGLPVLLLKAHSSRTAAMECNAATLYILMRRLCAGQSDLLECQCCFCEVPAAEATAMQCGHAFCNDCWRQHCVTQIRDGRARKLPCMGIRCATVCDEDKARFWGNT